MSDGHFKRTEMIPKIKIKGLFRTIPSTLFDRTIKYEKKSLRVKTFVLRKRLKNKQIVILMHLFVTRLPLETSCLPKRSNLMQNNLLTWKCNLHRNFCYRIHHHIRTLILHSDDNLFRNRPYTREIPSNSF